MQKEAEIQSLSVAAGSRTYFIDVKATPENGKYLSICESRRMPEGYHERHRIVVFEEYVHKVLAALQATLPHFTAPEKTGMQALKEKYPNAFKPWTQEQDTKLEQLFCEGKTSTELSTIFQRNPGAIEARIEKLELKLKYK